MRAHGGDIARDFLKFGLTPGGPRILAKGHEGTPLGREYKIAKKYLTGIAGEKLFSEL